MVLDNICLIRNEGMFCVEMALASVASWFGKEYRLMFSNVWKFDYKSDSNNKMLIGDSIITGDHSYCMFGIW